MAWSTDVVMNAHIPQHEGRGMTVVVEVEGGGNAKSEIVTQVTRVMISHTFLN